MRAIKADDSRRRARWARVTVGGALLLGVAAGCGSGRPPASSEAVVARVGDLEVLHPFLPKPPSPLVAALYLTIRNDGPRSDRLVSVTTPVTADSSLMKEDADGTMAPLVDLPIPAHGSASLVPGHDHLMLVNPTTTFAVGQAVTVTLHFAVSGVVTIEVPVVPLQEITNDGGMAGMS